MKVYVMVDFEGIAGMIEWDDYCTDTPFNQEKRARMRRILTGEANAAIEGVLAAGATEIVVWDSHGPSNNSNNLYIEDVHPEAWIIIGSKGLPEFYPLLDDSWDAGLYVGGHAMAGTPHAILPHTMGHINEHDLGEVGMFAAICGWHRVPMVFVSGDQATVNEVKRVIPAVENVVTKVAFAPYAAKTRAPAKARQLIREGAERALRRRQDIEPFVIPPPYRVSYGDSAKPEVGDNLREAHHRYLNRAGGFGDQDMDPERDRMQERRVEWQKGASFLVPRGS